MAQESQPVASGQPMSLSSTNNAKSKVDDIRDADEESASLVPRSGTMTAMNIEIPRTAVTAVAHTPTANIILRTFGDEIWQSTEALFQSKLTWLLLFGPIAVIGDSTGFIGEAACFTCAGLALIPCAERCVQSRFFVGC